jgi:hypothetical protein
MENPNEQTVLSALMNFIRAEGKLMAELAQRPTMIAFWQFISKAEEFINQEETVGALMKSKIEGGQGVTSNSKVVPKCSMKKRKDQKYPKTLERKAKPFRMQSQLSDQRWTPLNGTSFEVFMEIKRDPNFKWPMKMRTPP